MIEKRDVIVILPAYNEGRVIGEVVKSIINRGYDVLVVNDGSSDDTKIKSEKAGALVLDHVINRKGPGAPTKTGLEYAKRFFYKYAVLMDSDGQHHPDDISKLLKYAENYDVVIGSRMINSKGMPIQRKIVNFIGSLVTFFLFKIYVRDTQSGFKVLNRKAIESINITYDTFEFCSEMIEEIKKKKLTFKEVPIQVIYTKHSLSKAHGQRVVNAFKMILKLILKKK